MRLQRKVAAFSAKKPLRTLNENICGPFGKTTSQTESLQIPIYQKSANNIFFQP